MSLHMHKRLPDSVGRTSIRSPRAPLAIVFSIIFLAAPAATIRADDPVYDLVVYGGTSGGVAAAVQAARMGKTVVLIEPGKHLGGLTYRRPGRDRHRQQGGHRRHQPRVLSADQAALRRRRQLEAGEAGRLQIGPRQRARPRKTRCGRSSRTSPRRSSTNAAARSRSRSS